MKSIFYLLTILFLSLLISCSEEPPTNVESEILTKKPIKDPPVPPDPLTLLDEDNQIVGNSRAGNQNNPIGIIGVWDYEGGYTRTWTNERQGGFNSIAIGDVDNDGNDELVAIHYYTTGKKNNPVSHQELEIWENGESDGPTRFIDVMSAGSIRDVVIGKLGDPLSDNVILIGGRDYIQVWSDDGESLSNLWEVSIPYVDNPWNVEIGDADSDGDNEILYSSFGTRQFAVFDYPSLTVKYSEPVTYALDRVKVADVDGDGDNEMIGGGASSKLFVWEYENGDYNISFESNDLGGFTQGVAAGDFNGDGKNEIAVGTFGATYKVFVFKYDGATYTNVFEESISGGVNDMFAGDSDNDGLDEFIVTSTSGLIVYDYNGAGYSQSYSEPGWAFDVYVK